MDLERLPSGKFPVNALVLQPGMVGYNALRLCGQTALRPEAGPAAAAPAAGASPASAPSLAQRHPGSDVPGGATGAPRAPLGADIRTGQPVVRAVAARLPALLRCVSRSRTGRGHGYWRFAGGRGRDRYTRTPVPAVGATLSGRPVRAPKPCRCVRTPVRAALRRPDYPRTPLPSSPFTDPGTSQTRSGSPGIPRGRLRPCRS